MKNLMAFVSKQKVFIAVAAIVLALTGIVLYKTFQTPQSKVALPEGFPAIPVYPHAVLVDSKSDPQEGAMYIGVRYGASWKAKVSVPEAAKWYESKLQDLGWTLGDLPANPSATDVQLVTFDNSTYSLSMSFINDAATGLTTITAEFASSYKDFCKNNNNGKPCNEN